jgi:tRNA1Val (adenine37-N6)-methyltransferase
MPNPFFSFKQFTIRHDRCAMKVGTDGVLLGAWTDIRHSRRILDIGTGTGLISLMLAQRQADATITAIDIDAEAVNQAQENIQDSPWKERITAVLQDLKTYRPQELFDTIVSNPPYFIDSLKCPDSQRNTARHTDTLDMHTLLYQTSLLLTPEGRFSIVLPAEQTNTLIEAAGRVGLYPSRHTAVITRPGLAPKRTLMEFTRQIEAFQTEELVIELERHVYSEAYIALTKDFYLKM